jgi:hypothetical protein
MMGERRTDQAALFYEFSLERHVAATHLLRSIDRFVWRPFRRPSIFWKLCPGRGRSLLTGPDALAPVRRRVWGARRVTIADG